MSRIVLLHLSDSQVDMLTLAQSQEPDRELLVVHPQETALIRRLAQVAEVPSLDSPPEARAEDIVVTMEGLDSEALRSWKTLGAYIVSPEQFAAGEDLKSSPVPSPQPDEAENVSPQTQREKSSPGVEVLASPAASLEFLLEQSLGSRQSATLWWDGQVGLWTPWAGRMSGLKPQAEKPSGLYWTTEWGNFVLTGEGVMEADWNQGVLKRISEDMALRDLMTFSKQVREHGVLSQVPTQGAVGAWLESAATILKPQAAMAWEKEDSRWQLAGVVGHGILFSGSLKMDEALLLASFGESDGWTRSILGNRSWIYWRFAGENIRWPLYLKRLTHTEIRGE